MKAALYIRTSTADQNAELQRRELQEFATSRKWPIVFTFTDVASGATDKRPQLKALLAAARRREFDLVLCWKLDRFGRSMLDLIRHVQQLDAYGVRFVCSTQPIDTDQQSAEGRLMLNLLAAFSEFERSMIRDRSSAGLKRYQQDFAAGAVGKHVHSRSGRDLPPHRPRAVFDRQAVITLYAELRSYRKVGQRLGISRATVERTLKEQHGTV